MSEADSHTSHRRRPAWQIRTYILVLAAAVLTAHLISSVYERSAATDEARRDSIRDATTFAELTGATIAADIDGARERFPDPGAVSALVDAGLATGVCDVHFDSAGSFSAGRVDVIDTDGATLCTSSGSLPSPPPIDRPAWLDAVLAGPVVMGVVVDPVTARPAMLVGAPGAGGAHVTFFDLGAFAATLASRVSVGEFELLVTSDRDDIVVARSLDPNRWVGASLVDSSFAGHSTGAGFGSDVRDLDGVRRLYGTARIESVGWTVHAGVDRATALTAATQAGKRNVVITFGLLGLFLLAVGIVLQGIGRPISVLSDRVRAASSSGDFGEAPLRGPREVEKLAADFAALIVDRDAELGEARRLAATNVAILGSAIDSVVTIDRHGVIVEFNPAAERTFGIARDEAVGREMAEVIVPERFRNDHRRGLAHYLVTGEGPILNQRVELIAMRSDGSEFPVELTATAVDLPGPPLFTGYLRDLSSQVRARDELAASELRLQLILDNSPALIHMKDLDGRYIFVNREGERAVGKSREEILGHTDAELLDPEAAAISRADDLAALRQAAPSQNERSVVGPHGPRVYLSARFPLMDADGVAYGTAGISTDITERKQVEADRRFLQERLDQSQRLESLGQLAGGVAHDFNNLLAVILIHAKFVADQTSGQVRDDVEQISIAAERAAGLTRQLLVFGRRETVRPQPIDLDDLVSGVRDVLARGVGPQVELVVESEPDVPPVLADRGQLEQVLFNLAINARDAMPDGGTLTVRIATDRGDGSAERACVTVTDTGTGMTPEVASRAFEPFFTTKPPGQGTGLGLATVYGIVTEAGGTVEIITGTGTGTGTGVRILLPAASGSPRPPQERVANAPPTGHGETILVVDDEPALLAVTVRMLEENGYDVISASSADEALVRADGENIDLLLADFVMPKMSGSQLAVRMRAERPDLAVLLMSGYSHRLSNHQSLDDDDLRLLRKPFNERDLLTVVDEVISGSPAAGGSES